MTPKAKTFLERGFSTILLLAILAGALIWDSPVGYGLLICLLCNLTTFEWFNMLKDTGTNRALVLAGGIVYPWIIFLTQLQSINGLDVAAIQLFNHLPLISLIVFVILAFGCELIRMDYGKCPADRAFASAGRTILAFIYPVWLFAFALQSIVGGVWVVLWLILFTKMSDIWAYVSGVLLGGRFIKRRFSPVVSPKKTWEGIIGSFIITMICGALLIPALDIASWGELKTNLHIYLAFGTIFFILAVAGDLAGSLIKRGLAVKDSGSLLPGIGGIFDLIDSPAFTMSAFIALTPLATYFFFS